MATCTQSAREIRRVSSIRPGIQILVALALVCWGNPVAAEIDNAVLIGNWCLVSQTINGDDVETVSKMLSSKLRAKVGQSYQFYEDHTVKVILRDESQASFTYKVVGKKQNRLRIFNMVAAKKKNHVRMKRWEVFSVRSLTGTEMIATLHGSVHHRFTRGTCQ